MDYTSRSVKWKLFLLVASLLLVLFVAEKARDPKSWNWFFALDREAPTQRIDNRLPPVPGATDGAPAGTVVISKDSDSGAATAAQGERTAAKSESEPGDLAVRLWSDGLKSLWTRLSSDERTILFRLLESAQDHNAWQEAERTAAEQLLATMDSYWSEQHAESFQSAAQLGGDEQTRWTEALRQTHDRFHAELATPLADFAAGKVVLPDQEKLLARVLDDLLQINLERVRDDAAFLRPDEKQIWHHLFWRLRRSDEQALAAQSIGPIAYAQLYRQPSAYRGKVVTMRGTARWAYRATASDNHLGIKEYFVFWIQPAESADTPLVVYSLALPPGFPPLKDRDRDGGMTRLHDVVTFQGYFFKRGGYAGKGGTYNAPLLLARSPRWQPEALALGEGEQLSTRALWQIVGIALVAAFLVVGFVYWTAFRRPPRPETSHREMQAALGTLRSATPAPTVEESLRQLEKDAAHEKSGDSRS